MIKQKSFRAQRLERRAVRQSQVPKLNLVSLMDIFTILVFLSLMHI